MYATFMEHSGSNGLLKALRSAPKSSKVAKHLIGEEERYEGICIARRMFDETMDMFKSGDITWDEAVKEVSELLTHVEMKAKPMSDEEKKEEVIEEEPAEDEEVAA
jgi:hypothetical protein